VSATGSKEQGEWRPSGNPWLIAVAVTLAAFMEVLDTTIVNVALPHIAGTMSVSYDEATWALTAYLVANSIVLPISAFLARSFGRKRYFVICIIAFTICSFLCGISNNLYELIAFRLLQGFFGGGLQPNQQSIILDTFPASQRGKAFAISAVAIVVAPILGPTLGGFITDNATWRWVFLINVPFGVLTTFAVIALVEDPPWEKKAKRASTDFVGISLIALALGSFQVMLDRGEDADWFASSFIRLFASVAAIGLAFAIVWLLYTRKPVVDLRVMKDRNFALGCGAIAAFGVILYASAVLIPELAQQQLGYTATLAGLVMSPGALCVVFLIPVLQRVMPWVQTRYVISLGFLVLGFSMIYSRMLTPDIDFWHLVLMRSAQAIGIGFLFVPISTMAYLTLPKRMQGDGAALFTMFRNIAGSVGISLSTAMITSRAQVHMAYLAAHTSDASPNYVAALAQAIAAVKSFTLTSGTAAQTAIGYVYRTLIAQANFLSYIDVFGMCAIVAFGCIPFTLLFSPVKASGGGGH